MGYLRLFLLLVLFYGCTKESLKAPDAFFIKPENISVSTTSVQGTTSNKITDISYYVNGKFQGVYPIGSTLPIKSTGLTNISFLPVIKNNGISATRIPYEFYESIKLDTTVETGTTFNRKLTFKYKSTCKFHWIEDFEGFGTTSGITIVKSNNSDTTFTILNKSTNPNEDIFEGNKCLYFALDANRQIGQFQSTATFNLPKGGAPVYLELNYKCNQAFDVGVYSTVGAYTYVSTVNDSENWNKIYIQLSAGVSTNLTTTCGLFFRASKQVDNPQFYIDNIKIISYN